MTRDLNAATETASQADVIAPIYLVDLAFDAATLYFHTGVGELVWNSNTYTGTGILGGIGTANEDSELSRTPLELRLSGVESSMMSIILGEHYQGRTATVYLGYLDTETMELVDDPAIYYRGRMDAPSIAQDETLEIILPIENRFAAWDRPKIRRFNNADQQSRYPGDKGLEFVEQATEKRIVWGGV